MKKSLITTLTIIIFSCLKIVAQNHNECDKIIGIWLTENKDGKVEIYKSGNTYYGKLLWGNDMYEKNTKISRKDINNPDPKLRSRTIPNFTFLSNLKYLDGIWDKGKIYDARTGTSYDCYIKFHDGKIEIRAFVGLHMFGKTEIWTRIK